MASVCNQISVFILPSIIFVILLLGLVKKIPIYEEFVEGAKDGFKVSVSIIPYLVAIIVGVAMFRASGGVEIISNVIGGFLSKCSIPVEVLPIMITRSLSGSATLGIFSDIANTFGPDCYITKLAAIMVGSSETTFYVLAVYFGSVGIKKLRYAVLTGIIADVTGIVLAVLVARLFFLASSV